MLITLILALLLWLPRGLALDRFVAVDERSWMTRSGNFYLALSTGDLASTYQYYHPGVTTMWIGALAYLWQYPDYPADAAHYNGAGHNTGGQIHSMSEGIEDRLVAHGHAPMTILASARLIMVTIIVLLLLVAFWLAVDLLGLLPALAGILLLGFDPLTLGLTRMLHVDGLSSSLMLVSFLALMRFTAPDPALAGRPRDLILSGVMAGLAWLTKSPALFLGPMAALVMGIDMLRGWRRDTAHMVAPEQSTSRLWSCILRAAGILALWGGLAAIVFIICWPAMWVRPLANIQSILSAAGEYAEDSNQKIFFNGTITLDDPGALFYPITYLWHVTPVTLIGLTVALIAGIAGMQRRFYLWQNTAILLLYALLFALFINIGSKKIDRYLLPAYLPLALVAGVGWATFAGSISRLITRSRHSVRTATRNDVNPQGFIGWGVVLLLIAVAAQAAFSLPNFPYYFTFYNPLLGGITRAPQVLMIGLGEGIDEAARYLNAKPDAENLRVASWYRGGSFNYIFRGHDLNIEQFPEADYAVLYIHQWQRQLPDAQTLHYFAKLTPEYTVKLHSLDYAWVYNLHNAPVPSYFTDWDKAIRLTQTELPSGSLQPGATFLANFHLHTIGTVQTNLNAVVRLVDANGKEVARHEAWPFGSATSTWQPGQDYVDGHELKLPAHLPSGYLRVELGFYDSDAQKLVTPMVAGTETPRGDFAAVGYVAVGINEKQPPLLKSPYVLSDQIKLVAAQLAGGALGDKGNVPRVQAASSMTLTLAWQALRPADANYVTLVHLIAPDGSVAKQFDRAPLQGVVPTSLWREGDILFDAYTIEIPADLPHGDYQLLVGLYDLPALTRLPVQLDHTPAGDTIHVATVTVP